MRIGAALAEKLGVSEEGSEAGQSEGSSTKTTGSYLYTAISKLATRISTSVRT